VFVLRLLRAGAVAVVLLCLGDGVDGCGGQAFVRFFATAMIDTDKSDDSVNAYGDILTL
jgi:hypothetical protein